MTRETKDRWLIALVAPLALYIIISLISNLTNAASKDYVDNKIKVHEDKDVLIYGPIIKTVNETNKLIKEIHEQVIRHDEQLKTKEL